MRPPDQVRLVVRVISRIIIDRHLNLQPFPQIPFILAVQCHPVILRMPHDKDLPSFLCHAQKDPCLLGIRQDHHALILFQQRLGHLRMPGMGRVEHIVKASHQGDLAVPHMMREDPEFFFRQGSLVDPIVIVDPRLSSPAQMQGGGHIGHGPVHDLL